VKTKVCLFSLGFAVLAFNSCSHNNSNPLSTTTEKSEQQTGAVTTIVTDPWANLGRLPVVGLLLPIYRPAITKHPTLTNIEVVVNEGSMLHHYFYAEPGLWTSGTMFGSNVTSSAAVTTHLANKNLELVYREGNRLRHYFRDNTNGKWYAGSLFGNTASTDPAMVYHEGNKNLELVCGEGMRLRHYFRNNSDGKWYTGGLFGNYISSAPSMVYNKQNKDLELVVRVNSVIQHWTRLNSNGSWQLRGTFGTEMLGAPAITFNQHKDVWGNYTTPNLHVVVKEDYILAHYMRNYKTGTWSFMSTVTSNGDNPALLTLGETEYRLFYKNELDNKIWQAVYNQNN
jgi:hypothetical protein